METPKALSAPKLTRRAALAGSAALLAAAAAPEEAPGLNTHAMRCNRFYGAAIDGRVLADDRPYTDVFPVECGILTSEWGFKWHALRPKPDVYDFEQVDLLLTFAQKRSLQVRGHTLLWHLDNPQWLEDTITPANAESLLTAHIRTVASHCRNRVVHWDVVNEVLWPQDGKPLGLRDTIWSRALGPDALDIAFHACAETDGSPLRFINEYGLDYDWDADNRKREAMLALLSRLKARGVPVQGLGIQAHLDASVKALNQDKLAQFCADVASMGLKIVITELDVRDNNLPADTAVRDAAVASHAGAYLDVVLSNPAVLGVLTWGLSDRRSWLNDDLPRDDKLTQRALPLDVDLRRKPMWTTMAHAFDTAPVRA
ncbi:MAG: endo-1,4-beta-xylanase [Acetobacteraceae bacterium]